MNKSEQVEPKPTSMFLTVEESDVQVNDVANPKPGTGDRWTMNYYVVSVTDTHVELHDAFHSGTAIRPKSDYTFARIKP